MTDPSHDSLVAGRFRPDAVLDGGPVYLRVGTDVLSGRRVVIRMVFSDGLPDGHLARLRRDARLLRRVDLGGVAPVRAVGAADGLAWLVHDFVPGLSLRRRLKAGPLSPMAAVRLGCRLLGTLARLHGAGLVHRNVRPTNVILPTEDDTEAAVLVDFGLIRGPSSEESAQSVDTLSYQAPEQAGLLQVEADHRADLFAVGVLLYETLAGRPPFVGRNVGEMLRAQLGRRPVPLRALGVDVPRAFDALVGRLLWRDPRERYQSAASAMADLERLRASMEAGEVEPALIIGRTDPRRTLTRPDFVGREAEVAVIAEALAAAGEGRPSLIRIEGAKGTGRSRLARELGHRAARWGTLVLRGQGVNATRPLSGLAEPIEQLAEALQAHPDLAASLRRRLGEATASVRAAIPSLRRALSGGLAAEADPTVPVVLRLLQALGDHGRPALLVFDDAEALDGASLEALRTWRQAPEPSHLVVVVVVDQLAPLSPPLPVDRVLRLEPLGAAQTIAMAESMAGPLDAAVCTSIFQLSGGNPFAACAALRGLVEAGGLVHDVSGWALVDARSRVQAMDTPVVASAHLARLSDDTLTWLTAGAILGPRFSERVARRLSGLSPAACDFALMEAVRGHLVWHDPPSVCFVHASMAGFLSDRLSVADRQTLHQAAAAYLSDSSMHAGAAKMAHHLAAGGAPMAAAPHALTAARAAQARGAFNEAVKLYGIAEVASARDSPETQRALGVSLGQSLMQLGRYDDAQVRFERVLQQATTRRHRAEAFGYLGQLGLRRAQPEIAASAFVRGLDCLGEQVPESGRGRWQMLVQQSSLKLRVGPVAASGVLGPEAWADDGLVVELLRGLGVAWYLGHGPVAALAVHLRKINLVERYVPSRAQAMAYAEYALVLCELVGPTEVTYRYADQAVRIAAALSDEPTEGFALWIRGMVALEAGRLDEALADLRASVAQLSGPGEVWGGSLARYFLARCRLARGEFQSALADAALLWDEHNKPQPGMWVRAVAIRTAALCGRVPEGALRQAEANRGAEPLAHITLAGAQALRMLAHGQPDRAAAIIEDALRVARQAGFLLATRARELAVQQVRALRLGLMRASAYDRGARRRRARQLGRAILQARTLSKGRPLLGVVLDRERGLVAALEGRMGLARRLLDRTVHDAERLGMRHAYAVSLAAWAEVGACHGWPGASHRADEAARLRRTLEPPATSEERVSHTASLVDRFAGVLRAGRQLALSLSVPEVHRAIRATVAGLLRVERCLLFVVGPSGVRPLDVGAKDYDLEAINTALNSLEVISLDRGEGEAGRSILVAPIVVRGRAEALFYCELPGLTGLFGVQERHLAEFIATLAGAALDNAAGFDAVRALSRTLEERTRELVLRNDELITVKEEMEAFSYSVAHDLRGGLLAVNGYAVALGEDYEDQLDELGRHFLNRLQLTASRLGGLTQALMVLSGISRSEILRARIDVSAMVREIIEEIEGRIEHPVEWRVADDFETRGDAALLHLALENLLSNAAKFSRDTPHAVVEVGVDAGHFFVRDNGAGFDMAYADKLFKPFQRLHDEARFEGTGIGLATVHRVVRRHGGRISAEGTPGGGATFRFCLE